MAAAANPNVDVVPAVDHSAVDAVLKIALLMSDDWKAAAVLLLYVANPSATIGTIVKKIRIGHTEVCNARARAAELFPELASMLALKSPAAVAQRERRAREAKNPAELDSPESKNSKNKH